MEVKMIAAVGKNNELGKDNNLIWPIKEDLKLQKPISGVSQIPTPAQNDLFKGGQQ